MSVAPSLVSFRMYTHKDIISCQSGLSLLRRIKKSYESELDLFLIWISSDILSSIYISRNYDIYTSVKNGIIDLNQNYRRLTTRVLLHLFYLNIKSERIFS